MPLPLSERRIRRDLRRFGIGVLQVTSKAPTRRQLAKDVAVVDKLIEDSQVGVLTALFDGRVTLPQLVDADRRHELQGAQVLANVALAENLWTALDRTLRTMGKSKATRQRYGVSRRALEAKAGDWLSPTSTVKELALVEWDALSAEWGTSASDWNHVRRLVSRFLTLHLGHKYHPFRIEVVGKLPMQPETERVSQLTPDVFFRVWEASPEHLRPVWMTLVLTGMRVRSEYLRCTADHLLPAITSVRVPGTKTPKSSGVVKVDASLWPWVEAAIPAPRRYKALRDAIVALRGVAGVSDLRLHDFRHAMGQWAADEGVGLDKIRDQLRHTTVAMTMRYTRQAAKGEVARSLAAGINARIG